MSEAKQETNATAKEGHDEGFGPVCLYDGEKPILCNTPKELKEAQKAGYKDGPTKAEPKKAAKKV